MVTIRTLFTAGIALTMALATSGCGQATNPPDSCPADAKFAAIWSSETENSQLTFYDETGPIGSKQIDVKGFIPGHEFAKVGDEWVGVSNGDTHSDVAHIVRFNPTTCEVTKTKVDEVGIWNYAADETGVYVVDTLNWQAQVHAHLATGENVDTKFPDETTDIVATSPDALLLVTSRVEEPTSYLLRALDKTTLEELWQVPLPIDSPSTNAQVIGDTLYFTEPYTASDTLSNKLIAVGLKTKEVTTTELIDKLPYVLAATDSTLYIGNTFMNPSFGPLENMRTITKLDLTSGEQQLLTAEHGISQLRATENRLVVYGDYDADLNVALTSYKMPGFEIEYSVKLERPESTGHIYGAGFLLLDEE